LAALQPRRSIGRICSQPAGRAEHGQGRGRTIRRKSRVYALPLGEQAR